MVRIEPVRDECLRSDSADPVISTEGPINIPVQ